MLRTIPAALIALAVLAATVAQASSASAATIDYTLAILLVPGDVPLTSSGGPTFESAGFTPGGTLAADAFAFNFPFGPGFYDFTLAGCAGGLTGHVNGGGDAVTALSGTCFDDVTGQGTSIAFSSDNTAFIDIPQALLGFNATYTLVPEPSALALAGALIVSLTAARRRR